ncbi:MAG: cytochrome c oxidase subunit 3, partial [Pseudomonadota bacterium]
DRLVFALFFATYLVYRAGDPASYAAAASRLDLTVGTANTLALLTSSWLLALATHAARMGAAAQALRLMRGAIGLGLFFVIGKLIEYAALSGGGADARDDAHGFVMFYLVFTGVHFLHVGIGLLILALLSRSIAASARAAARLEPETLRDLESAGAYWHMVDLLWIVLFALFYVLA